MERFLTKYPNYANKINMNKLIWFLIIVLALNSCSISNRIIETDDPYKELKSIHLKQYPSAYSAEKVSRTSWSSYRFTTELFSEINSANKPEVRIKFQITTGIRADELDSVLYLRLDQEKIRLVSADRGTSQLMVREFILPENLWLPIAHSGEINYRLYLGREGIDIELTNAEANKVKEFFSRIIRYSEANFPVVPEGQMKW
jgi:hypothetical protein